MSLDNVAKRAMREESAKYNGWTNYATWRVNLEVFDGLSPEEIAGEGCKNAYTLSKDLQAYAEDLIFVDTPEGLARDYALAFMADVNWVEIANHMIIEHCVDEEQPVPEDVWKNAING